MNVGAPGAGLCSRRPTGPPKWPDAQFVGHQRHLHAQVVSLGGFFAAAHASADELFADLEKTASSKRTVLPRAADYAKVFFERLAALDALGAA